MYIKVYSCFNPIGSRCFQWLLFSHTGLVMARSDSYKRHSDAVRIGKQIANRLRIDFEPED